MTLHLLEFYLYILFAIQEETRSGLLFILWSNNPNWEGTSNIPFEVPFSMAVSLVSRLAILRPVFAGIAEIHQGVEPFIHDKNDISSPRRAAR